MRAILKFSIVSSFIFACSALAYVRSIYPKRDAIVPIRTAIGIATIIQVPDPIQSAIIGDASAYKIEYLNDAVTIKPLRFGARTNLYLITQKRRYNLQLWTTSQGDSDYVVYIKEGVRAAPVRWTVIHLVSKAEGTDLAVTNDGHTAQGYLLIDGSYVPGESTSTYSKANPGGPATTESLLMPKDFWVYQGKTPVAIDTLYLSKRQGSTKAPVHWSVSINAVGLHPRRPLVILVKGVHSMRVTIPARFIWQ